MSRLCPLSVLSTEDTTSARNRRNTVCEKSGIIGSSARRGTRDDLR
jgi:hypothetical protein